MLEVAVALLLLVLGDKNRILKMVIATNERCVVFDGFPLTEKLFLPDVRPILERVILRYGLGEWRAAVLTNELHGHLGIYSLLGVKMGILARELLAKGESPLTVCSHAGTTPPLSCLNDGLQVATGATLGRGTIRIEESPESRAEARFYCGPRGLKISLRQAVADQIAHDITHGRTTCGDRSPSYWHYVRRLALSYWLEFDRHEIFETEEIVCSE